MPASLVIIDRIDMEVSPWGQRGQAAPWGHKLGAKHKPVQALPLLTDTVPQDLMMGPKAADMTSNEPWPGSVQGLQAEAEGNRARDRAGKKLQYDSRVHPYGYTSSITVAGADSQNLANQV